VQPTSRPISGYGDPVILLRHVLGTHLRSRRQHLGRTLRQVSADAQVSLGYLSEIERGQKEASSELLGSICGALDASLSEILAAVAQDVAVAERAHVEIARAA
jgi:transcriptional regulator with XRE-family HTH domain